jgi:hypothetical protein
MKDEAGTPIENRFEGKTSLAMKGSEPAKGAKPEKKEEEV